MPDDVPPRPGAPGYDEFIAHKQDAKDAPAATPMPTPTPVAQQVTAPAESRRRSRAASKPAVRGCTFRR